MARSQGSVRPARSDRRSAAGLFAGFLTIALVLAAGASATGEAASARFSAQLTTATLTSAQAGAVKLAYRFVRPSKSFSYRLSLKNGAKWKLVSSAASVKKSGRFTGSRTMAIKALFAGKPLRAGSYRLRLTVDKGGKLLGFRLVEVTTKVSAGAFHSCALPPGGRVECWGSNGSGQLGNGTTADSSTPVQFSGISNAAQVSAGGGHTCALRPNGTVVCKGDEGRVPGVTTAVEIDSGYWRTCARLADGTVWCWGGTPYNHATNTAPARVPGIKDAVAISVGGYGNNNVWDYGDHVCAVLKSGAVECWGSNGRGQLGNGSTAESSPPVRVKGVANAIAVSAGDYHTCALLSGGTVKCWGAGYYGQLGDGSTMDSMTPVPVSGIRGAISLSAGSGFTCAVLSSGAVECWGYDEHSRLGDGGGAIETRPVPVRGVSGAVSVSAGEAHACASLAHGAVKCWGANESGQLGNGKQSPSSTPVGVIGIP